MAKHKISLPNDPNHLGTPTYDCGPNYSYERELLAVDCVKVNRFGGRKDVGQIYGGIWIKIYGMPWVYIFRRSRTNPETVRVGGHLTLSVVPVWAMNDFSILVNLYDAHDDAPIASEDMDWLHGMLHFYNQTNSWFIVGNNDSSIIVNYSMASYTMMTQIDVMFKGNDNDNDNKYFLHGSIVVEQIFALAEFRPTKFFTIFDRSEDECLEIVSNESIPLDFPHLIAQKPKKRPSLKICVRLNGYVRGGRDGKVISFKEIKRDVDYYLNFRERYMVPRIFYFPVEYQSNSNKFSRFLQVFVTPF